MTDPQHVTVHYPALNKLIAEHTPYLEINVIDGVTHAIAVVDSEGDEVEVYEGDDLDYRWIVEGNTVMAGLPDGAHRFTPERATVSAADKLNRIRAIIRQGRGDETVDGLIDTLDLIQMELDDTASQHEYHTNPELRKLLTRAANSPIIPRTRQYGSTSG